MAFPALTALGFTALEDSKLFSDVPLQNSLNFEVDGGLIASRKRFTRNNLRQIQTGYTFLTDADKEIFDQFCDDAGLADTIVYTHPTTAESLNVVFVEPPTIVYSGVGESRYWDITSIKLRTV
jgi:hypothetical protein